jgi:hexosaminidase
MKRLIALFSLAFTLNSYAQQKPAFVPMPSELTMHSGNTEITSDAYISVSHPGLAKHAALLQRNFLDMHGIRLPLAPERTANKTSTWIRLAIDKTTGKNPEGYSLVIRDRQVMITGNSEAGLFYGIQTFLQLGDPRSDRKEPAAFPLTIPELSITDFPRFKYRGMHLDVARHFEPVSFVKKYIDFLAAYKFNTFHWHLTDDQGWRIEIKKYPKLTQVGGYRNGTIIGRYPGTGNDSIYYGGFYTQEEIKEVVKYAAEKYITVIPEIEMPGHASAAIAAYPQLSCFPAEDTKVLESTPWAGSRKGKQVQQTWGVFEDVFAPTEYTFNFLEDVVDEVMQLFPSTYIHIGGDECPKESWKRSAFCQQLIKSKKLKDEHGLQSYFIQRMERYINSKGRKIIGWDEILEGGLAPNATVMSWRGEEGGIKAANEKHDVIMTPGNWMYFDHSQSTNEDSVTIGNYTPLEEVYSYDPLPAKLKPEAVKYILGAQANLWTEYIKNPAKVEYMIFPRITALSEVLWTPQEKRNWKDYESRLPGIFQRLDQQKINYSKAFYELKATLLPAEKPGALLWKLESVINEPIFVSLNNSDSLWQYTGPMLITNKTALATARFKGTFLTQKFSFNKATGRKISLTTEASKGFPGDGPFTLVNGVQNERALSRSREFLGFAGKDMEAVIDLGQDESISTIILHAFEQTGSWIYRPLSVSFYTSDNGTDFTLLQNVTTATGKRHLVYEIKKPLTARYIKVLAKNMGIIPSGKPGAGNPAWLFVDEIEVK